MPEPTIPNPDRPAFPTEYSPQVAALRGLSKREYFAGLAMAGYLSGTITPNDTDATPDILAASAIRYADALLFRLGEPIP